MLDDLLPYAVQRIHVLLGVLLEWRVLCASCTVCVAECADLLGHVAVPQTEEVPALRVVMHDTEHCWDQKVPLAVDHHNHALV